MRITDVTAYVAKAYVGKPVTGFRGGFMRMLLQGLVMASRRFTLR